MLLNKLIESQTQQYQDIQAQIDLLLEEQRRIQAFLQQLGSIESQMESAVKLVQEAVKSITETCPDELANYKEVLESCFDIPIAVLPEKEEAEEQEITVEAVTVEGEEQPNPTVNPPNIKEGEVIDESQDEKVFYEYPDLDTVKISRLREICRERGLSDKGIKNTLINRILDSQST